MKRGSKRRLRGQFSREQPVGIVPEDMTLRARISLHRLGKTKTGIAIAGVLWGILEFTILLITTYLTLPLSNRFVPDTHPLTTTYDQTIWAIAIMLIVGLAALMGYLLQEERSGFLALLLSQAIAFPLIPWAFVQLSLEPLLVVGVAVFVFFVGSLAVLVGAELRDQTSPDWRVNLDWRFLAAALLADTVAIFWPVTPPIAQGYTPGNIGGFGVNWVVPVRLGDLAFPIMAILVGLSLFLALLGLRRATSTAYATLPIWIGSVIVAASGVIAHAFASVVEVDLTTGTSGPQVQAFQMMGWLLVLSIAVPTIIFLATMSSRKIASTS